MGVRFPFQVTNTIVNATLVTVAETIVALLGPFNQPTDSAQILLLAYMTLTTGASTTGYQGRIRRGTTLAGALVGAAPAVHGAGGNAQATLTFQNVDTSVQGAGAFWVLTIQLIAATANGSIQDVAFAALSL